MTVPETELSDKTTQRGDGEKEPDLKFWLDRIRRLCAYQDLIKRFLHESFKRQAQSYNANRRNIEFKVGDKVLYKTYFLSKASKYFSSKLAKTFSGPYTVLEKLSRNVYKLDLPKTMCPKAHIRFLKPFVAGNQIATVGEDTVLEMASWNPTQDCIGKKFPPIPRRCFNCLGAHRLRACPHPMVLLCKSCGWKGHTIEVCPRPMCQERFRTSWKYQSGRSLHFTRATDSFVRPNLADVPETQDEAAGTDQISNTSGSDRENESQASPAKTRKIDHEPGEGTTTEPAPAVPSMMRKVLTITSRSTDPRERDLHQAITYYFGDKGYKMYPGIPVGVCAYLTEEAIRAAEPQEAPDLDLLELYLDPEDVDTLDKVHNISGESSETELQGDDYDVTVEVAKMEQSLSRRSQN